MWQEIAKDVRIPIHFSEGPTRALAAMPHGIVVVGLTGTSSQGWGDDPPEVLRALGFNWKGRDVYVVFNSDAAHNEHVKKAESKLCDKLLKLGAKIREPIRIPAVCGRGTGLEDLIAKLGNADVYKALCAAAPLYGAESAGAKADIVCIADVEDKDVEWLWENRVPLDVITGLEGNPGCGKSWIGLNIAACGSRGREPFTKKKCAPFNTVYMGVEMPESAVRRRYMNMGGDPKRLSIFKGVINADGSTGPITLDNIPMIERTVTQMKSKLLIIDPIQSFLGSNVDMHRANETRPVLDELTKMAGRQNMAILIIRHTRKASEGGRAIHQGMGSIDIAGTFRSIFAVGTAADNHNERAMIHIKPYETPRTDSLAFTVNDKDIKHSKLVWKGVSHLTVADLTAPEGAKKKSEISRVKDYMLERFDSVEKIAFSELVDAGFKEHNIRRARNELGLRRTRDGEHGPWMFSLNEFAKRIKGAQTKAQEVSEDAVA